MGERKPWPPTHKHLRMKLDFVVELPEPRAGIPGDAHTGRWALAAKLAACQALGIDKGLFVKGGKGFEIGLFTPRVRKGKKDG